MQRFANLVDLEKCCKVSICLQKSASIQPRTRLSKFGVVLTGRRKFGHFGPSPKILFKFQNPEVRNASPRDALIQGLEGEQKVRTVVFTLHRHLVFVVAQGEDLLHMLQIHAENLPAVAAVIQERSFKHLEVGQRDLS